MISGIFPPQPFEAGAAFEQRHRQSQQWVLPRVQRRVRAGIITRGMRRVVTAALAVVAEVEPAVAVPVEEVATGEAGPHDDGTAVPVVDGGALRVVLEVLSNGQFDYIRLVDAECARNDIVILAGFDDVRVSY